ncbi:MAG: type II CRISPR-associated endonuclease Cas1 [Bacilli bacterium]|jgi:CRISPR-associated protein Cas1
MSWRIVYIESSDYLSLYLDNIKIKNGMDETTIPLSDINSIVIDNNSTAVTVALINKCMEYKINMVMCNLSHLPNAIIIPHDGNYQSAYQLQKQIKWEIETLKYVWNLFVKAKIRNQVSILRVLQRDGEVIKKMLEFMEQVEDGDSGNREGLAAKMYFRELFGDDFKRYADDSINAALNYGYSILRSQIARALVARGLNPQLGIFHRGAGNAFNLADDFIEPLRPIIDKWVYENIKKDQLFNRENRLALIQLTTKKIEYNNRKVTIIMALNILIDNFLDFMDTGDVSKLVFPNVIVYDL